MKTIVLSWQPKQVIDLNKLATAVSAREGGAENQKIAQISETQCHVLDLLGEEWRRNPRGVAALLESRRQADKPKRAKKPNR
ncbi:MAG: hypothetical protein IMZ62_13020 [Chloroflexi bacterium]|nr:hypothetical protein [Chloroflexota bacterium]